MSDLDKYPCVKIQDATLFQGDCLEILPLLPKVDAVVTDPPYGVSLGPSSGHERYIGFVDDADYVARVAVESITIMREKARIILTPGNRNAWLYPPPDDMGVWYNPAGTGCGKWGFILAHIILYYGIDPYARKKGWMASSVQGRNDSIAHVKGHPCPKPELFMRWMVEKSSIENEIVVDPFMGSGTTGVACAKLGRKFIGIELEPKYFDIACKRIEEAYAQPDFFVEPSEPQKQDDLLEAAE